MRAVVLDVDGTLVDGNDAPARAWLDALAEAGRTASFAEVRRRIGMGCDKLLPEVAGLSEESPEGSRISARRSEIFKQRYLPTVRAFPRARELLQRMRDDRLTFSSRALRRRRSFRPSCGSPARMGWSRA